MAESKERAVVSVLQGCHDIQVIVDASNMWYEPLVEACASQA